MISDETKSTYERLKRLNFLEGENQLLKIENDCLKQQLDDMRERTLIHSEVVSLLSRLSTLLQLGPQA